MERRRYLASVTAVVAASLAGCGSPDDGGDDGPGYGDVEPNAGGNEALDSS